MTTFIVPAFNEADNIAATVHTIRSAADDCGLDDFEVIIVDDGSSDGTPAEIDRLCGEFAFVRGIRNSANAGMGVSLRRGIEQATYGQFVVVPGDNDMTKSVLVSLLRHRNATDVVMAFPINIENRSLARNVLSIMYRMMYMISFRIYVNYVNAPCVYPTNKVKDIYLYSNRMSIIAELTTKLLRLGCTYSEAPGYFQWYLRARPTVSLKNLAEVIVSFTRLFIEIQVLSRRKYSNEPVRVHLTD